MTIKQYKKLARANAKTKGTSYQAELNAIADRAGYDSWGPFQKVLENKATDNSQESEEDLEIADLLDALRFAIGKNNKHLVICRGGDLEKERIVMNRLRKTILDMGMPVDTYRFLDGLTNEEVALANSQSRTLVAGSKNHVSMIHSGNCVVSNLEERLYYTNSLTSRRDLKIIESTTQLSKNLASSTVSFDPTAVGKTTITRKLIGRTLESGTSEEIREQWNMPIEKRPFGFSDYDFIPAFNPLGYDQIRKYDWDRVREVAKNISKALIPSEGYFREEARKALTGLIILHVDHSWKSFQTPSLPGVNDMINEILKGASSRKMRNKENQDTLHDEIKHRIMWMTEEMGVVEVTNLLSQTLSAPPRERSGILGTVDQSLIIFRHPVVQKITR